MICEFALPWPPSINHYWRRVGNRTLISREGRAYRKAVGKTITAAGWHMTITGRINVDFVAYQPDKRARDLDNLLKAPLDALEHARVYESDSQIDALYIERAIDRESPRLVVTLSEA